MPANTGIDSGESMVLANVKETPARTGHYDKSLRGFSHKVHSRGSIWLSRLLRPLPIGRGRELPCVGCILKRKFPESTCARPVGL